MVGATDPGGHKQKGEADPEETLLSRITTGAAFATLALVVNRASGMFLQMILVRMISVDEFGLFKLAIELSSFGIMFATFFVGGVSASSTTRMVSIQMAAGRRDRIRSGILSSVVTVVLMSAILFPLVFFSLPWLLERVFEIRRDLLVDAISFFRWFVLYILLSCVSMVLSASLRSSGLFKAYSLTESAINVLRLMIIPVLIHLGLGLNGIVWGWSAAFVVGIIPAVWILERFTRPSDRNGEKWSMPGDVRELMIFGLPVFVSTLSSTVYYSSDTLIIGYFLPVKFVGIYGAGIMLVHSLLYLFSGLETALFPILSASLEKKEEGKESRVLRKGCRLLAVVTFPAAVYSFVMAPYMIRFLFGPEYLDAVPVARILAVLILAYAAMPAGVIFLSTGRPDINARLGVISAILNIALSFVLVPSFGIQGAATANALGRIYSSVEGLRICKRLFNAPFPWRYCLWILGTSSLAVLPVMPVFWLFSVTGSFIETFLALMITACVFGLANAMLVLHLPVLDGDDRWMLRELLMKTPLRPLSRFVE